MKIAVCVKQVVDVAFCTQLEMDTFTIPEEDTFYIINPADSCASELAVRTKEKYGGEVVFISFGPPRVHSALQKCLAMGGDKAFQIWEPSLGIDSLATPNVLAKMIMTLAPDIILCGSQSLDTGCAETPAALAEILNLPQVTGVLSIELSPDGKRAIAQRKLERGRRQTVECSLPAVFAIESEAPQPRYAGLPQLLAAYSAEIIQVDIKQLNLDISQVKDIAAQRKLIRQTLPRPRPKKLPSYNTKLPAELRMDALLGGGIKKSKSTIWEGTPQELARRLAELLIQTKTKTH